MKKEEENVQKEIFVLKKFICEYRQREKQLKQQIEKMKCCANCVNESYSEYEEPCLKCDKCSKWEIKE